MSEEREPIGADAGGDSYPERIAAFRRVHAETLATATELTKYMTRSAEAAEKEIEAINGRISALVGADRDDISDLDDDKLEEYKALRGRERELKTISIVSRETLDRLETSTTAEDLAPKKDNETSKKLSTP